MVRATYPDLPEASYPSTDEVQYVDHFEASCVLVICACAFDKKAASQTGADRTTRVS